MTTSRQPAPACASPCRVPRSAVWHCLACGGYQMHDMLVTQPLVCIACGARGLVAARPGEDVVGRDLPMLGGTG